MKTSSSQTIDPVVSLSLFLPSGILDYFTLVNHVSQDTCFILYLEEKATIPAEYSDLHLHSKGFGSVVILGGLSLVNSLHAYTFASLKRKKLISTTPLNDALNALILALNASAAAFVLLFTKKFKILS